MSYSISTTERNCVWCVVDALCETGGHISMHYLITGTLFVRRLLTTADGGMDTGQTLWTLDSERGGEGRWSAKLCSSFLGVTFGSSYAC